MKNEQARSILRDRGMCGEILTELVRGRPVSIPPAPDDICYRACILPIGHDDGIHEGPGSKRSPIDFAIARDAYGELGAALDSAEFAPPESTAWKYRAAGAMVRLASGLGLTTEVQKHVDACPIGWKNRDEAIIHRGTSGGDIVAWLKKLHELTGADQ